MTRVVFEMNEVDKITLIELLKSQGKTFTDWFTEKLSESITPQQKKQLELFLKEVPHPGDISDAKKVASDIQKTDWSFTYDDTGFLTHDIHPYPAKYIPQIPSTLIRRLSLPGELILDPFGGSGTTATESVRLGRKSISIDANPLATLIGKVKTSIINEETKICLDRLATTIKTYLIESNTDINTDSYWKPDIPNINKWFNTNVIKELTCINKLISELTEEGSKNIALLALSRIIVRVSNQDSETRYVAKIKNHPPLFTLRTFLDSLEFIQRKVELFSELGHLGEARFYTGDSRNIMSEDIVPESVSLIVTSPPYPNATDYHLYHRFRIFWLGYDPRELGKVEIGSHLKHQRKNSGFYEYIEDMTSVMKHCYRVLSTGRYAVFIVGDAVFNGESFDTAEGLAEAAKKLGFEHIITVERPIHLTKRSFSSAARRARSEKLLVLRKPDNKLKLSLLPTNYKLYPYEQTLREMEINCIFKDNPIYPSNNSHLTLSLKQQERWKLNRLTFTSGYKTESGISEDIWQKMLENNGTKKISKRKESKYLTHGIHAYKGKFYPQLAKSLINITDSNPEATILDPFCGSGTVLLEGYLNGFKSYGCDMNPLAIKIAKAKTEIITLPSDTVDKSLHALIRSLQTVKEPLIKELNQFQPEIIEEIFSWFPTPVVYKLNWLLGQIRLFGDTRLVNFLEVILSDCIRNISQQEPSDLRIRRRSEPLSDAPVIELFHSKLQVQYDKLKDFWSIKNQKPFTFLPSTVIEGDCRERDTFRKLGLVENSVDAIVTSPPYATALPYIDTDRLSIMAILGLPSATRRIVEEKLTGSREIRNIEKANLESSLFDSSIQQPLPKGLIDELRYIHNQNILDGAGFRRLNMPALLYRYFTDMNNNLQNIHEILRAGGKAYYVVGDSKTKIGNNWFPIKTTEWLIQLGRQNGFKTSKLLDISVTTENLKHIRHAITDNAIIMFEKN